MRFLSALVAAVAATLITFTPSLAVEKKTIPANKTSGIGFFYFATNMGHNCQSSGRGKFKVSRQPEHGVVRLEWRKLKADFQGGCKNSTMGGVAAWYTPHKGFRGQDDFTIRIDVPGLLPGNSFNTGRSWKIRVDVQ
jgi:hypothetical protein